DARTSPPQLPQRVIGEARANLRLGVGDDDARMPRQGATSRHARLERRRRLRVLKRIAGRDEPPESIEPQAPQRDPRDREMTRMRGVEGAAKQADAQPRRMRGKTRDLVGRAALRQAVALADAVAPRKRQQVSRRQMTRMREATKTHVSKKRIRRTKLVSQMNKATEYLFLRFESSATQILSNSSPSHFALRLVG